MSAGDIDTLLNLWGASAVSNGGSAPFQNHKHLYDTIDATPLGDVPSWMNAAYDVWFPTLVNVFTISSQIQTLRVDLTMLHIRNMIMMTLTIIMILCLQIGQGNRQCVLMLLTILAYD
jgi:hypothetical protein